jgi:RNA polymerase sigma factor (sigma-70 family)
MKIAAITQFKHGMLYEAMRRLGWDQAELARRAAVYPGAIHRYVTLKGRPSIACAKRIHDAFLEAGVFFDVIEAWPKTFRGNRGGYAVLQIAEVNPICLHASKEVLMLEAPDPQDEIRLNELTTLLSGLPDREQNIIQSRFFDNKTLEQVGQKLHLTRERVRQIEKKALRTLRKQYEHIDKRAIWDTEEAA